LRPPCNPGFHLPPPIFSLTFDTLPIEVHNSHKGEYT
jgi:hypothetical protein